MNVDIEHLPQSRVKLTLSLDPEEFKQYYDQALAELAKEVRLPGFRVGQVPKALAEKRLNQATVQSEAVQKAVPLLYYQAVSEHGLHPIESPQVEVTEIGDGLKLMAEVDVLPEVSVKDWRKIKVKPAYAKTVEDFEVDNIIEHLRREQAILKDVTRGIAKGDFVNLDFSGTVDGVPHEGMQSKNHPLIVGEGAIMPDFEDHLMGMQPGPEKTFTLTFPKDYRDTSLANKEVVFKVKVNLHKQMELPPPDDKLAARYDQKSLSELKSTVLKRLEAEAATEAERQNERNVLKELIKRTKVTLPASLVREELDRIEKNLKERLKLDDTGFASLLARQNKDLAQFRESVVVQARQNAIIGLALGEIMKEEGIKPEEKEAVRKTLDKLLESATS